MKKKGRSMNPTIQAKQSVVCQRERLRKTKILRNIFINLAVLFALARLLAADTSDGALNLGQTPLSPSHPTLIRFDPPGAIFTSPAGINPANVILGVYADAFHYHGFVRLANGTIVTFDAPGGVNTTPGAINPAGAIV